MNVEQNYQEDLSQSSSHPLLSTLNPEQQEAASHFTGPILILAGAGSGKTRVLTHRVAHLVMEHGINPGNIIAVTFTNKATEEMRNRLLQLLGSAAEHLWISTFHSGALRILRRHASLVGFTNDFVVYDQDDAKALVKNICKTLNINEKEHPPAKFLRAIDRAKNELLDPEDVFKRAKSQDSRLAAEVYDHFQRELKKNNAMDFGDLLFKAVRLFESHPEILAGYQEKFKFILVDEFQDTNVVQYRFLKLISAKYKNLLVVGDDDQSIYRFRGADISNILNFEKDFPNTKVVKLEQNYRSSANILQAAHAVIEKNKLRKQKKLWTSGEKGSPVLTYVADDEGAEARFIAKHIQRKVIEGLSYKDIAIFYRTNAQSRAIEEALMQARIPYIIFGGLKFYERKEIRDILAYIRLIINPNDNQAFLRVVNTPPRGIGAQSVQGLADYATEKNLPLYPAAEQYVIDQGKSKGILQFVGIINELKALAKTLSLGDLIRKTIELSEYEAKLKTIKDPTVQSRIENLRELEANGASFARENLADPQEALRTFLDKISLSTAAEIPAEQRAEQELREQGQIAAGQVPERLNKVSMMTLHIAKGLEFPQVFLAGVEEGLLPHYRAIQDGDPDSMEEERRLCYVGITRAMKELVLTRAVIRGLFSAGGGLDSAGQYRKPSRFAPDIPEECLKHLSDNFASGGFSYSAEDEEDDLSDLHSGKVAYGVFSADQLERSPKKKAKQPQFSGGAPVNVLDVTQGTLVMHPFFGQGEVESIDGDPSGPPEQFRVTVRFPSQEKPKKLIWKFAGLSKV